MLSKAQFNEVYRNLHLDYRYNKDFIYSCYTFASENADELVNQNVFGTVVPVNPVVLILYIVHEYSYIRATTPADKYEENEELESRIVSLALDKYFTNEHLNYKNDSAISKYAPPISTLETYLNFCLNVLSKSAKKNPNETLILDVLYKGFSMCKGIIQLMQEGYETEAFSQWRTLHETECVAGLLVKYGRVIHEAYIKHIEYTMAFRGVIQDKEKVDKIFVQIKDEIKALNLKSKDMKKYIEYGWLSVIPNYNADPQFKFNFRDGVEKLAGLARYSKVYEMASEIAHSSPMLIYSKNSYFFHVVLLNLYESFFRLESIFNAYYEHTSKREEKERFHQMRNIYYTNLQIIYKIEREQFKLVNKNQGEVVDEKEAE